MIKPTSKNIVKLVILLNYALTAIICMNPYFTWETFAEGKYKILLPIAIIFNVIFSGFYLLIFTKKIKLFSIIIMFFLLFLEIHFYYFGTLNNKGFSAGAISIIISIYLYLLFDNESQGEILKYFTLFFIISILPSVIYFIFRNNSIFDFQVLAPEHPGKIAGGIYYEQYFGGIILCRSGGRQVRLCGIYDEPGVVGTFAALLLAQKGIKTKINITNICLFISGFFSFSLAFYILFIIEICLYAFFRGIRWMTIVISIGIMVSFMFFNINTNNEYINSIRRRFDLSQKTIFVDNRTSSSFDVEFEDFFKNGGKDLWLGFGVSASDENKLTTGSSSYKNLIYDYGLIGFSSILFLLLLGFGFSGFNASSVLFIIIFLASMYQRPYVFNIPYMLLYWGTLSQFRKQSTCYKKIFFGNLNMRI